MKPMSYCSDALAAIHATVEALHDVGAVDKRTMREFDATCVAPEEVLSAAHIKSLRERERIARRCWRVA